jgi:hypothetical protein
MAKQHIPNELKYAHNEMMEAEAALIDFVAENQEVIDTYERHRQHHQERVDEVKRLYAKHVDAVGKHFFGFRASTAREVDVDRFLEIMDEHGADPTPYLAYRVVLKKLDEGLASGEVPKEVIKAVGESAPRISMPKR